MILWPHRVIIAFGNRLIVHGCMGGNDGGRVAQTVRNQDKITSESSQPASNKCSAPCAPSRWKEPLRHTLIRLRAQKPALFGNRPIPLREEDIRRDDAFTAILAQEVNLRPVFRTGLELGRSATTLLISPFSRVLAFLSSLRRQNDGYNTGGRTNVGIGKIRKVCKCGTARPTLL